MLAADDLSSPLIAPQEFHSVLVWAFAPQLPERQTGRMRPISREVAFLKRRQYAAVVTWNGYLLPFADHVAHELGVGTR